MCIISVKYSNIRKWTLEEVEYMMRHNADGCGVMYREKLSNLVKIEKGFFSPSKAYNFIRRLPDDAEIVFHARIATHGNVSQGNCHPFPLYLEDCDNFLEDKDLQKPRLSCSVGLAHNGVLKIAPQGILSDTGTFCKYINSHFDVAQLPYLLEMLDGSKILNSSRLAILTGEGKIYRIGSWYEDDSSGLFYSNFDYPANDKKRKAWWLDTPVTYTGRQLYDEWDDIPIYTYNA